MEKNKQGRLAMKTKDGQIVWMYEDEVPEFLKNQKKEEAGTILSPENMTERQKLIASQILSSYLGEKK